MGAEWIAAHYGVHSTHSPLHFQKDGEYGGAIVRTSGGVVGYAQHQFLRRQHFGIRHAASKESVLAKGPEIDLLLVEKGHSQGEHVPRLGFPVAAEGVDRVVLLDNEFPVQIALEVGEIVVDGS